MEYVTDYQMVRVDFFKPSGKWYTTEDMRWLNYSGMHIHDAFKRSLRASFGSNYNGMVAVCLKPYHEHEHPLMCSDWGID